jgi:AraC-like DNA-binding protein
MLATLYSLTSGAMLLLTFLIATNPRAVNRSGNRWLAFFLGTLFFLLIDSALAEGRVYQAYPHLWGLDGLFIFAAAPALYFCVSRYISPQKKFKKGDFLHFLPATLLFPLLIGGLFIPAEEKLVQIREAALQGVKPDFFFCLIWLQMVVYLGISLAKLRKHQKNIEIFASDTAKIDLNWLKYFLIGLGAMLFLWVVDTFNNSVSMSLPAVVGYFLAVCALGYFALRQEEIFPFEAVAALEINEIIEASAQPDSIRQQRIPEAALLRLKEKLGLLMADEKPYLDETLSLPGLAEKMGVSVHNLSYLLNEGFHANFFQFINQYRIEEAKKLLVSPAHRHLSMVGIAYECGFSSKTTFNTTFKKMTGMSPTAFVAINQHKPL